MQEGGEDARARAADGVAQRDRAAVGIQALGVEVEFAVACDDLRGEGFVQFDGIVVGNFCAGALRERADCRNGANSHDSRVDGRDGRVDDARERLQAEGAHFLLARQHDGRSAVRDSAGIAGGDRSGLC